LAFGLLLAAANGFADTFLNLAANVFGLAFDLVLVHGVTSSHQVDATSKYLLRCAAGSARRTDGGFEIPLRRFDFPSGVMSSCAAGKCHSVRRLT
jgi:hypothetical protein